MQYNTPIQTYVYMIRNVIFLCIFIMLSGCVATKQTIDDKGIIKLSENGDYIRAIKTPVGYYYNNPKDGKFIRVKK